MDRHPTPDRGEYDDVLLRRAGAYLVDGLGLAVLFVGGGFAVGAVVSGELSGGMVGMFLASFISPFGFFLYFVALEGYYGQTVGKQLLDIVVVDDDGSEVSWTGAIIRNIIRFIDILPAFYALGVAVAYVNDRDKRLGDMAGGTLVVATAD